MSDKNNGGLHFKGMPPPPTGPDYVAPAIVDDPTVRDPRQWLEERHTFSVAPWDGNNDQPIDVGYGLDFQIHSITADPTDETTPAIIDHPASIAVKFDGDAEHDFVTWDEGGRFGGTYQRIYLRNTYNVAVRVICSWKVAIVDGVKPPWTGFYPRPISKSDIVNLKNLGFWYTFLSGVLTPPADWTIFDLDRSVATLPAYLRAAMDRGRPMHVLPTRAIFNLYAWDEDAGGFVDIEDDFSAFALDCDYRSTEDEYIEEGGDWDDAAIAAASAGSYRLGRNGYKGQVYLIDKARYANQWCIDVKRGGPITRMHFYCPTFTLMDRYTASCQVFWEHCPVDPMLMDRRASAPYPGRWL